MSKIKDVLVIDDDPDSIQYIEFIFNSIEITCDVVGALNGALALEWIKANNIPDVIFLDINMPMMNGWEFLEEYYKLPEHQQSLIMAMLTVSQNSEDQAKAEKFGIRFISKPIKPDMLLHLINEFNKG